MIYQEMIEDKINTYKQASPAIVQACKQLLFDVTKVNIKDIEQSFDSADYRILLDTIACIKRLLSAIHALKEHTYRLPN